MRAFIIVGIILLIVLTLGFTAGGSSTSQPVNSIPNLLIEKALPAGVNPAVITGSEQSTETNSIFSWSTIISLSVAVIGIVAFRRNTYY